MNITLPDGSYWGFSYRLRYSGGATGIVGRPIGKDDLVHITTDPRTMIVARSPVDQIWIEGDEWPATLEHSRIATKTGLVSSGVHHMILTPEARLAYGIRKENP